MPMESRTKTLRQIKEEAERLAQTGDKTASLIVALCAVIDEMAKELKEHFDADHQRTMQRRALFR